MKTFQSVRSLGALLVSLTLGFAPFGALVTPSIALAAGNLIANGSLDAHTTATAPTGWGPAGFDGEGPVTNKVSFTYVEGRTATSSDSTDKAVQVTATSTITGGGDAKWLTSTGVDVGTGGEFYTFSDWYKSDVTSYLLAEITYSGTAHYMALATLNPTGGAWVASTADFSVPTTGVPTSIRVFHLINAVGTLTTDDYSLIAAAGTDGGFAVPVVSLTFDDGWTSQFENALPKLTATGFPATFYVISTSTAAASYDLVAVQATQQGGTVASTSANGTTWSPIFRDPTVMKYRFSDTYTGSASTVTLTYVPLGGATTTVMIATLPEAVIATRSSVVFTLPATALNSSISISHTGTPTLSAQSGSLMGYDSGYMSNLQLKDILATNLPGGKHNEIGNHTEDHCSLSRLLGGSSAICAFVPALGATVTTEINHANSVLNSMLGITMDTLAYPFGEYNAGVKTAVTAGGLVGARTVDYGYNRATSDKLALKTQTVDNNTTLSMVQGWVETAKANHLWLILVFHQVDDPVALASNGETGGVSTETFNAIIDYLQGQSANITVATVHDAIALMSGVTPTDTTPPVIAAHANVTAQALVSSGIAVTYSAPGFTDAVAPLTGTATCTPASNTVFLVGTTTVTCSASDTAGNAATPTTFKVVVAAPVATSTPVDTTKPVITLFGSATVTLTVGDAYTELGASAHDDTDGAIATSSIVVTGTVNTAETGTNTIHYNVSDAAGNAADEVTRSVVVHAIVHDTVSPTPTPVTSGGGGGGGNGPIFAGSSSTLGVVLGTTTTNVPAAVCADLLPFNLLYLGPRNDKEKVKFLQSFLNTHEGERLPVTGLYASLTRAAVSRFQMKYSSEILAPLGLTKPTGHTAIMTRAMINKLLCLNQ